MSLWMDTSYAKQLAYRLAGYKEKSISPYLANFRCPVCNDSAKKANKKRGYFYVLKNSLNFRCHNCNASMSFGSFLKQFDPNLFERYSLERYRNDSTHQHSKKDVDIFALMKSISKTPPETKKYVPNITDGLRSVEELDDSHPAKQYVVNRMIPKEFHSKLFYVPKFVKWTHGHTNKFKKWKDADHPRLVIPWYSEDGAVFAYTARAFGSEEPKYYKIVVDDSYPPFYGMNRVDIKEQVYVVEGPIDSMFLPNCIAVGTSSLHMYDNKNAVYITDRDVRNKEVMREVGRLINESKKVVMLPDGVPKDINEMILEGYTEEEILQLIDDYTYQGLSAKLHFILWRKIND